MGINKMKIKSDCVGKKKTKKKNKKKTKKKQKTTKKLNNFTPHL
jgi:hypothetical protein